MGPTSAVGALRVIEPFSIHNICLVCKGPTPGFQSGPVPGTFTRLRACIVPAEITEPPKNHKYDGR